jgi:hypothetical protein
MRALLPLISASGFLIAAGAIAVTSPSAIVALGGSTFLIVVAAILLCQRDAAIAVEIADELLDLLNRPARPAERGGRS